MNGVESWTYRRVNRYICCYIASQNIQYSVYTTEVRILKLLSPRQSANYDQESAVSARPHWRRRHIRLL